MVTPMDRIVHGVNKLTCALHDAPHIPCENQLLAIDVIHYALQRWKTTKRTPQAKPPHATLSNTCTRPLSILRPMHRPQEDRPPASPPRVFIPNPPAIPVLQIPITSQDEPLACHTRPILPPTDRALPRVHKTVDTAPIARHTR